MKAARRGSSFLRSDEKWTAVEAVTRIRYADIPNAVDTLEAGDESDPLRRYLFGYPESAWSRRRHSLEQHLRLLGDVRKQVAFTINGGDALICYLAPEQPPQEGAVLDAILDLARRTLKSLWSKESKERDKEFVEKYRAAMKEAFGSTRPDNMVNLYSLCTHPRKQRRGYGTTLVKFVTDKADALSRPTYLCSSNVNNAAFYEACGFITVAEFTLGDTNPKWKEPPIILCMMMRPYTPTHVDEKSGLT